MRVGLFLDVDEVLTVEAANLQIARRLNVAEQLQALEQRFGAGAMSNDEFNQSFIPLFKQAGFTKNFAEQAFESILKRIRYGELLGYPDSFLVSSGPSFFVHPLADKHQIPRDRVLCSEYSFDADGTLLACKKPASSLDKAKFVEERKGAYDLIVGVGNNPEQDGPFLSHCHVKVLLGEFRPGYISVSDLPTLIDLMHSLCGGSRSGGERERVFVVHGHDREMVRDVENVLLKQRVKPVVMMQQVAHGSQTLLDKFEASADVSYAIVLLTPDDQGGAKQEDGTRDRARQNVLFEAGYFVGRLGRERVLLLHKGSVEIPTDLAGVGYIRVDGSNAWQMELVRSLKKAGFNVSLDRAD
jgi:phosphoserine phosphatase